MEPYGTDSRAKQTKTMLNHRATNNGKKAVKAISHKDAGPERPQHGEQKSNRDRHKVHGNSTNNATQTNSICNQIRMQPNLQKDGRKEATVNFVMDTGLENLNKYKQESAVEKITGQGVKAVNAVKKFITVTAINFVVPPNAISYPIRNKFLQLIKEMQSIEAYLTILAAKGDDQWTIPDTVPSGNEFTTQFAVRTESTKRGNTKIV
eukprot:63219-Ditylum_brightwellii.AAC.1